LEAFSFLGFPRQQQEPAAYDWRPLNQRVIRRVKGRRQRPLTPAHLQRLVSDFKLTAILYWHFQGNKRSGYQQLETGASLSSVLSGGEDITGYGGLAALVFD
jgi:hypothetical protein